MEMLSLTAERREPGKTSARKALRNGKVPGVYYGYGKESVCIQFDALALVKLLQSEHSLLDFDLEGRHDKVLVRDYDQDPITGKLTHIDIMSVRMDRPIDVWVPIKFNGTPIGVKTKGGITQHDMTELHIKCLPSDIPGHVDIDVENLDLGDSIHVRDLSFDKMTLLNPGNESVVTVVAPKAVEAVLAEAAAPAPTEPELVGEKGKEKTEEEAAPEKTEKEKKS